MVVLGYLPKSKRDLALAYGTYFRHDFPLKMVYRLTTFQCHNFFYSQDIKENALLSSYSENGLS